MGGVAQLGGPSWPVGVGAGQVGGASSSQFGQSGVGGVGQRGGPSWRVGVGAGQMGGTTSSSQCGQMGDKERRVAGVGGT